MDSVHRLYWQSIAQRDLCLIMAGVSLFFARSFSNVQEIINGTRLAGGDMHRNKKVFFSKLRPTMEACRKAIISRIL
jgi:hypothetical protein